MIHLDQTIAIDAIRQFLKLHATCGGASVDAPSLPDGVGYRVLAACRCGDTTEYWLTEGLFARHQFLAALAAAAVPPLPPRGPVRPIRKVA